MVPMLRKWGTKNKIWSIVFQQPMMNKNKEIENSKRTEKTDIREVNNLKKIYLL